MTLGLGGLGLVRSNLPPFGGTEGGTKKAPSFDEALKVKQKFKI